MKKTTKALLWSALIFPGLGHYYLKKYLSGSVLLGLALAAFYYLSRQAIQRATQVSEQILNGSVPLDAATIAKLVTQAPTGSDAVMLNIATLLLGACWLVALLDIYRLRRSL
ncbi:MULTISPECIES: hypothetical protein [unclassified Agarivorans]|uniref:hypothetical protein n=1 Tax=unclassified Agarivorans TaxID=2636026 RepID=UPI003D7CE995